MLLLHKESPILENDQDCPAELAKYQNASWLGNGVAGVALKVDTGNGELPLVVKIMPRNDQARLEIDKALRVDRLLAQTLSSVFSRVHGWIACGPVTIPDWKREIEKSDDLQFNPMMEPCFFMVTQHAGDVPLHKYPFTSLQECRGLLFEIFYALYRARVDHRYHHNDLHTGNVMVSKLVKVPRSYTLDGVEYVVEAPSLPIIIDYGYSTFGLEEEFQDAIAHSRQQGLEMTRDSAYNEYMAFLFTTSYDDNFPPHEARGPLRDVFKLLKWMLLKGKYPVEIDTWIWKLFETANDSVTFQELLESDAFWPLRTNYVEPPAVQKRPKSTRTWSLEAANEDLGCLVCGRVATQVYEHAPTYRFCDDATCAKAMGPIGWLVQ